MVLSWFSCYICAWAFGFDLYCLRALRGLCFDFVGLMSVACFAVDLVCVCVVVLSPLDFVLWFCVLALVVLCRSVVLLFCSFILLFVGVIGLYSVYSSVFD